MSMVSTGVGSGYVVESVVFVNLDSYIFVSLSDVEVELSNVALSV